MTDAADPSAPTAEVVAPPVARSLPAPHPAADVELVGAWPADAEVLLTDPRHGPAPLGASGPGEPDEGGWRWLAAEAPDLLRLLRAVASDGRVPWRAKVVAASALAYVAVPIDLLPGPAGIDDLVVVVWALRRLVAAAGYDVVRELWTGSDRGFAWLIVLSGVDA